jgi:hypothetical protein
VYFFVLLMISFSYTCLGRVYRLWILQIIRDGMKSELDFQVSQRCVVFKLVMSFYSSVLADDESKVGKISYGKMLLFHMCIFITLTFEYDFHRQV